MNKLVEEIIKPLLEDTKIKKVVGIYGGRFQPFGPHHYKTYKWLAKQVDEAYITTSNIKKPPRHPMNFKEKVRHMSKMGVPSNRIIEEKSPYVAKNLAKKYDEETTVFVYVFGAKDAGRLGGSGKYFKDYKKNKENLKGHIHHGYYLVAPHVSISVGGKEVSGTSMRTLLGSPKLDDKDRVKLFKKMFGYYNKGIFNMLTNKFKKLFELKNNPNTSADNHKFNFEPAVQGEEDLLLDINFSKFKPKLKKLFKNIKKEMRQNKKLGKILTKYVKQGGKLSSSDRLFAKQQFMDALKLVGLTGAVLVPFGKFSIPVLVKIADMVGFDLLPSSFRESVGLALPDGTINGSPQHPSQKKARKRWEDEEEEYNQFMGDKEYQYKKMEEGLPTKVTDKYKKLNVKLKTDAERDFYIHHSGDKQGHPSEPDTYDWDDDDKEEGGVQDNEKDRKKLGYEPVTKLTNKYIKKEDVNTIKKGGKDGGDYRDYDAESDSDWEQPAKGKKSKYVNQKKLKSENVNLPIEVGDTIKMGRFKNKKVKVKSITWNERGDLLINGRPALKFRILPQDKQIILPAEEIDEFLTTLDFKKIIKEGSTTGGVGADDGPSYAYGNFTTYRKRNKNMAKKLGMNIVNYILQADSAIGHREYREYPDGPVKAVSYAPAGVGGGLTPNNQFDLMGDDIMDAYSDHIDKVATTVGMELVDYLYGINQDLFKIIGSDAKQTDKTGNRETPPDSKRKTKKEQHKDYKEIKENKFTKDRCKDLLTETDIVKNKQSGNTYTVKNYSKDKHTLVKKDASEDEIEKVTKKKSTSEPPSNTKGKFKQGWGEDGPKDEKDAVGTDPKKEKAIVKGIKAMALNNRGKQKDDPTQQKSVNIDGEEVFNLCKVTVPGTNLYCEDNKGIPREKMPQLKAKPVPGSKADKELEKDKATGEVNAEHVFLKKMQDKGVKVRKKRVKVVDLKATQNELKPSNVAFMVDVLKTGKPEHIYKALTKPIIVSKDGHILDGHHRWAAMVALDISNGGSGDIEMDVVEVDMGAEDMIKEANKFTEDMGLKAKAAEKDPTEKKKKQKENLFTTDWWKNKLNEGTTNNSGYKADAGEPDTGHLPPGVARRLGMNSGKPEPWFNKGGYTQLKFPVADDMNAGHAPDEPQYEVVKRIKANREPVHVFNLSKLISPEDWVEWFDREVEKDLVSENIVTKTQLKPRGKELLLMGGAYGHMAHPFDDKDLTFGDLKNIITNGLGGQLNREDNVTEKLDGQNIMISWKDGKLIAARNKGHIKNGGKTALTKSGIKSKFKGRGNIADAFNFAMNDLEKSIGALSEKQRAKIFNNGHNFMNLEVMWPKSANVIDYDLAELIFHGALMYDDSGTVIGEVPGSARMLAGMIKQVNMHIGKKYSISKPVFLTIPKHQDFGKMKDKFIKRLNKLRNQYALKDNDTLALYHQSYWEEYIYNAAQQFGYTIPNKILKNLTKRWAFFDKSYKIPTIKSDLKEQSEFLKWVLSTDKDDHKKMVKENMKPFEELFFEVGAEILKNVEGFIAANPKKAVQNMKKKLSSAISKVKSGGDLKKLKTLKLQLDKLNSIGGTEAIVPSEGIVFKYKGKTYKFTGAFAPINQITGLISF